MHTAHDLYSDEIIGLPASEQLRLATLILQGLTASTATAVDFYSDEWSEEDLRDLATFSLRQVDEALGRE